MSTAAIAELAAMGECRKKNTFYIVVYKSMIQKVISSLEAE
jgi:hypothetical protein